MIGSQDWYVPAEGCEPPDDWDSNTGNSLQDQRLMLLFNSGADSKLIANRTDNLFVTAITADSVGGCQIMLSGGYALEVFPCASTGEAWRLFEPDRDKPHFVVDSDRKGWV